jgi:hypothetical protein
LNPDFCGRVWRREADVEATDLETVIQDIS